MQNIKQRNIIAIFTIFGLAYLLSSLLRGVTAALAPSFVSEFDLNPTQLGLLGGAYFLGFAAMQLPMGSWLDKYGTKVVLPSSLILAVIGTYLFGSAQTFEGLLLARLLTGVGVSGCLIAPLTAARLWVSPAGQQQINLWMLMAGALGLLIATLPIELLAEQYGWRSIFTVVALLLIIVVIAIFVITPKNEAPTNISNVTWFRSYGEIIKNPYTWKIGSLGFFNYAILVAVQTLWVGPWLTNVVGRSEIEAATDLFWINTVMLFVFMILGAITTKIVKSKSGAEGALKYFLPLSIIVLALISYLGDAATWHYFALYLVTGSVLALTHPAVGQHFEAHLAGRAISFYNLLLFLGVFFAQWGVGLIINFCIAQSIDVETSYQIAFIVLTALSGISYIWFVVFDRFIALRNSVYLF